MNSIPQLDLSVKDSITSIKTKDMAVNICVLKTVLNSYLAKVLDRYGAYHSGHIHLHLLNATDH